MNSKFGAGGFVPDVVDMNPGIDRFGFQPPFTADSRATKKKFTTEVPFGESGGAIGPEPGAPPGKPADDPAINYEKYFFLYTMMFMNIAIEPQVYCVY